MHIRRSLALIPFVVVGALTVLGTDVSAQREKYEVPFSGQPLPEVLKSPAMVICDSHYADTTGYYLNNLLSRDVSLMSVFLKQSKLATWKIFIQGSDATVIDEEYGTYQARVLKRDSSGVVLLRLKDAPAGQVEVYMIDPASGSFVMADSGVGVPANRTNVWVGRCRS